VAIGLDLSALANVLLRRDRNNTGAMVASGTLAQEDVQPHLAGRFGRPYIYEVECESTQLLIGRDAPEGTVAATDFQSAGRGRLGRGWHAPPGTSVHCSIVLRPPPQRPAPELTLVGAIAAAKAIEGATGLTALIKWPNDVMLSGRKVAGVLGELREDLVVLGIGINVNQEQEQLPADARQPPGSLQTSTGRAHNRAALLGSLLLQLERAYDRWRESGLAGLQEEIETRDFLRGRDVSVDGIGGRAVGIDRLGRLELDIGGERRLVETGEVSY
jgi:BirA family transcriptional regulator, biotin operon repressor / biotin---[acetyl-CoA-carboxylase] ligase